MSITAALREAVRARYGHRCGYCGVPDHDVGNELEIDHFHPQAHGGTDDLDNLVYACPACNRFNSDYWPAEDAPEDLRLLHPGQDDLALHIAETVSGRLVGLTPRGWFHIRWLHLNRPLLVTFRQLRQRERMRDEELAQARAIAAGLEQRVAALERELTDLRVVIARLAGQEE